MELETLDIGSIDLDIFMISKRNTRMATFVRLSQRFLANNLQALPQINPTVLRATLQTIWAVYYSYNLSYHNDLHNLDVAQMAYLLMQNGPDCFAIQLRLTHLEQFAIVIAALCHDYAHDGFMNSYHVAQETQRFLEHGESGCQEKYHFAESFKCIETMQLLSGLTTNQYRLFKRRMQQCIFATDMAKHMEEIKNLKELM